MPFDDPLWPRASAWLAGGPGPDGDATLAVIGLPTSVGSISPSQAWQTPSRFRDLLAGCSTFDGERSVDLADLPVIDMGDWDLTAATLDTMMVRVRRRAGDLAPGRVYAFIGGDNAVTRPVVNGLSHGDLAGTGVLTLDAHHDVRLLAEGPRNGTPIRGLIEDGLPGSNVTQVGIHSFANSAAYRAYCEEQGIVVKTMADVDALGVGAVVDAALSDLAARCERIYVDFDIDVLDRTFAPGCPGSRPGGMTPRQLMDAARRCGRHPAVIAADFVEVDAAADRDDVTVLNLVQTFLAFASGVAERKAAT
jgi:arginase family enzyme